MNDIRNDFLNKIKANISAHGYHITMVFGGVEPRFFYTIGMREALGYEFIFPGGIFYKKNEIFDIIDQIIEKAKKSDKVLEFFSCDLGLFTITPVHESWSKLMMLGVYDYYSVDTITAMQIIPNDEHYTLDVPDMSIEYNSSLQPVWKWLTQKWEYALPENTMIVTDISALQGNKIIEVFRWEEDYWEAFSSLELDKENARVVSLGTLIGIDPSLEVILDLDIDGGLKRDKDDLIWYEY